MAETIDSRIHVTMAHLRRFQYAASGLRFLPHHPSKSVLNGRHRSRLRGRGLNFEEMRDYLPGDDVRSIDWKTTARMRQPYVRVLTEERDRPVIVVTDQRMPMFFGSRLNMKSVTAAEITAIATFVTLQQGDRIGTLLFNETDIDVVRPMRSQRAANRILNKLTELNQSLTADKMIDDVSVTLNDVLDRACEVARHDHLIMIVSDFAGIDEITHRKLRTLAQHNDLILALVFDPAARDMANRSTVVSDGRLQVQLNLADESVRQSIEAVSAGRLDQIIDWQKEINLTVLPISAGEDTLTQVRRLLSSGEANRRVR